MSSNWSCYGPNSHGHLMKLWPLKNSCQEEEKGVKTLICKIQSLNNHLGREKSIQKCISMEWVVFYFPDTHWTERKAIHLLPTVQKTLQSFFHLSLPDRFFCVLFGGGLLCCCCFDSFWLFCLVAWSFGGLLGFFGGEFFWFFFFPW